MEAVPTAGDARLRGVALLSGSVSATVSCMRRNAKFAHAPPDEALLDGLRTLRKALHGWKEWEAVPPAEFLAPFLAVVRSDETSGPITASALAALHSILSSGLVAPSAPGAADAMHALVDAVTHCRFEVGNPIGLSGVAPAVSDPHPRPPTRATTRQC